VVSSSLRAGCVHAVMWHFSLIFLFFFSPLSHPLALLLSLFLRPWVLHLVMATVQCGLHAGDAGTLPTPARGGEDVSHPLGQ
jgi:hypothetical protein